MLNCREDEVAFLNVKTDGALGQAKNELTWARKVARHILAHQRFRWAHTQGVVRLVSQSLAVVALEERSLVLAAAYVHDLGHARPLRVTGCHALDGAMYVRAAGYLQLASMVAQHSGARCEATLRGLESEMSAFPFMQSSALDLLTYSDLMTDHRGYRCSVDERLEGVAIRYGNDHILTRSLRLAEPELRENVSRVESRLRAGPSQKLALLVASGNHRSVA
jgi:hypothetical protein